MAYGSAARESRNAAAARRALACLADPTRRRVFERLRTGPLAVGVLARGLPVSRPAVSQHLKALKAAGLVHERPDGTQRIYAIRPDGLVALKRYLDRLWDDVLAAYKEAVENGPVSRR